MNTNNKHLKTIAENTGSEVTGTHSNNYYLKRIVENTTDTGSSSNVSTVEFVINYTDNTTETLNVLVESSVEDDAK